jgi:hypothetical protein
MSSIRNTTMFQKVMTSTQDSIAIRIFVISLVFHLLLQIPLNALMPQPYYSQKSMGDADSYYTLSENPVPQQADLSPNKYRRILLPLLVYVFFGWDRYLGFLLVDVIAVSAAAVLFYQIARRYTQHPLELTVLFAAMPYLFASAHLGYTEPLMVAFLLAGYYVLMFQERVWQATGWLALATLSKEIALFPILAMVVLYAVSKGPRKAWPLVLAPIPAAVYYLAMGLHWHDPLFMLRPSTEVEQSNLGSTFAEIARLFTSAGQQNYVPSWFLILNQVLNVLFFLFVGFLLYSLRTNRTAFWFTAISGVPLLSLGWAVVFLNWHVGRQALIIPLCLLGLDTIIPKIKPYLTPILMLLFAWSIFQSLYWARFFWAH